MLGVYSLWWVRITGSGSGYYKLDPNQDWFSEPEPEFVCLFFYLEEPDPKPYSWFYLCVELKPEYDAVSKE
jgi:hypothetical protein